MAANTCDGSATVPRVAVVFGCWSTPCARTPSVLEGPSDGSVVAAVDGPAPSSVLALVRAAADGAADAFVASAPGPVADAAAAEVASGAASARLAVARTVAVSVAAPVGVTAVAVAVGPAAAAVVSVAATSSLCLCMGFGSGWAGLHCPDSRSCSDVRAPSRHVLNFLDHPHGACTQLIAHLTAAHASRFVRPAPPAGGTRAAA